MVPTILKSKHWKSQHNGGHFVWISNSFGQNGGHIFSIFNDFRQNGCHFVQNGTPLENQIEGYHWNSECIQHYSPQCIGRGRGRKEGGERKKRRMKNQPDWVFPEWRYLWVERIECSPDPQRIQTKDQRWPDSSTSKNTRRLQWWSEVVLLMLFVT